MVLILNWLVHYRPNIAIGSLVENSFSLCYIFPEIHTNALDRLLVEVIKHIMRLIIFPLTFAFDSEHIRNQLGARTSYLRCYIKISRNTTFLVRHIIAVGA